VGGGYEWLTVGKYSIETKGHSGIVPRCEPPHLRPRAERTVSGAGVRAPQHTCGRRVGVAGEEAVEEGVEARLDRKRGLRAHAGAPQGA
jgi:hypothetical protein